MAKKARRTPAVVTEQKEAARILGVTARTIRNWLDDPECPDCSRGYNLKELRAYQERVGKGGSDQREQSQSLTIELKQEQVRQQREKTVKISRENEIAAGNLVPLDEYRLFAVEIVSDSRDKLLAISIEFQRHLCRKCRSKLPELQAQIETALHNLSRLSDGPSEE